MKVAGIILIILQVVAVISRIIQGGFAGMSFFWLIGYFLVGIIGVILLVVDYKKNQKGKKK